MAPALDDRLGEEITDWEAVKLLSVQVDRLRRWCAPGVLCIGGGAYAMSPAKGVGINLATQDALATANILGPTFAAGGSTLRRVQRRRELPCPGRAGLPGQVLRDLYPKGGDDPAIAAGAAGAGDPVAFRPVRAVPALRHLAGRFIGYGIRPEHVRPRAA